MHRQSNSAELRRQFVTILSSNKTRELGQISRGNLWQLRRFAGWTLWRPFFVPQKGNKIMKKLTTKQIALSGVVAGLYAAITILTASFAYGNIQFRIADAMCLLVCIEPSLTIGLTLGCLIANIFSTVSVLDIVIGTAATLLGCLLTIQVKKTWILPIPTILANAVMVGAMLAFVYTPESFWQGFAIMGAEVAAGEIVVLYLLGVPLYLTMKKTGLIGRLLRERNG